MGKCWATFPTFRRGLKKPLEPPGKLRRGGTGKSRHPLEMDALNEAKRTRRQIERLGAELGDEDFPEMSHAFALAVRWLNLYIARRERRSTRRALSPCPCGCESGGAMTGGGSAKPF